MTRLLDAQGLEISHEGHRTRLKWHRLRKRFADPLFSAEVMAEGFAAGASMELDLRVRGDGGFVVLHDEDLEGETTGHGPVAEKSIGDLSDIRMQEGDRPLIFSEDLAAMMQSTHATALLQFDMKDDFEAIGARGIAHLAAHFQDIAASVIVSGGSLDLTRREFELLHLLAEAKGQVLEREAIYQRVWGYAMAHGDRSVDVFVRKLRKKLEAASPGWVYLHTHFGVGYRFDPQEAEEKEEEQQ
jgi:DNA-binding winged helix-turn-helix (wHTH) protein